MPQYPIIPAHEPRRRMKTFPRPVVLIVFLFCMASLLTFALPSYSQQAGASTTLAKRVQTLEALVVTLEKRISVLEAAGVAPQPAQVPGKVTTFDQLDGKAVIIASDGVFLGLISSNSFDAKSITNEVGTHGSEVASNSIFNSVGRYGSEVSSNSPWNDLASSPPKVFVGETFVGYLTKNEFKKPRFDPEALVAYLKSKN